MLTLCEDWPKTSARILDRCAADPLFFCKHIIGGEQPWQRQADILTALCNAGRVAVRSGHGVGKTWTAARAALWYLYSHPHAIVLTTAPTHRQVKSILWAEIRRQVRSSRIPLGGRLTETGLSLDDDWFAMGLSTDEPDRFQGYHAEHLLLILDEAPGVSPEIYEAARGLLTSEHARILLIGNPTVPFGPFYEAFRNPGWHNIHIACTHSPNVTAGRTIYPKLVTKEWIEAQRAEWGEDSPAFRSRVLGEFPEEGDSRLVPLAWLHAAQERLATESRPGDEATLRMGVDVARYGADLTVIALADATGLRDMVAASGLSTMETTGRVISLARQHGVPPESIAVDDTGVGGGVTDRLREQDWPVQAINAASRPLNANFANRRAELFWAVREALNPEGPRPVSLPGGRFERLTSELSQITYHFNSRGRILVESKDKLRARLGASPDYADAFALTFASGLTVPREPRVWTV